MKNILFVCSQNRLRSPTAERVFSKRADLEVDSAGTNHDAVNPVTAELVEWADVIFVMEKRHRICLDIPDVYTFMQEELVATLERKAARHLPTRE